MSLLAPVAHSEAEGLQEQVLDVAWILVAKHGCVVSECGLEARVEMACAAESALGRYSGDWSSRAPASCRDKKWSDKTLLYMFYCICCIVE